MSSLPSCTQSLIPKERPSHCAMQKSFKDRLAFIKVATVALAVLGVVGSVVSFVYAAPLGLVASGFVVALSLIAIRDIWEIQKGMRQAGACRSSSASDSKLSGDRLVQCAALLYINCVDRLGGIATDDTDTYTSHLRQYIFTKFKKYYSPDLQSVKGRLSPEQIEKVWDQTDKLCRFGCLNQGDLNSEKEALRDEINQSMITFTMQYSPRFKNADTAGSNCNRQSIFARTWLVGARCFQGV